MTRFIFRNPVVPSPDPQASWRARGRRSRRGKLRPSPTASRNSPRASASAFPWCSSRTPDHYEQDARPGINVGAGSFSEWPKEAGLAAPRDTASALDDEISSDIRTVVADSAA